MKEDLAWHFSVWTSQNRRNLLRANRRKVVTHSLRQKFWRDGLRNWRNWRGQGYGDFTDVILWAVCEDTGSEDHRLKAVQWVFVYVFLYCILRLSRMRWLDYCWFTRCDLRLLPENAAVSLDTVTPHMYLVTRLWWGLPTLYKFHIVVNMERKKHQGTLCFSLFCKFLYLYIRTRC